MTGAFGGSSQAEPPAELLDGRYRVLHRIGCGGMGEVYAGEHVHLGRPVAIKFLRGDIASRKRLVERFRFEARAAAQLCSDNVATVLDFGVTETNTCYLVMERLHGETLADRLARRGTLQPSEAAVLVGQAACGAQAAHEAQIIHCDLKPSNLFIVTGSDQREQVKLLDFGVATSALPVDKGDSPSRSHAVGTPSYMSPEQAGQNARIDALTDVYALGVILYRMLTGRLPFVGSDPVAIRCRILRDEPVDVCAVDPSIPEGLGLIVRRAMSRDRAIRYPSAQALAEALQTFVSTSTLAGLTVGDEVALGGETLPEPSSRQYHAEIRRAREQLALPGLVATGRSSDRRRFRRLSFVMFSLLGLVVATMVSYWTAIPGRDGVEGLPLASSVEQPLAAAPSEARVVASATAQPVQGDFASTVPPRATSLSDPPLSGHVPSQQSARSAHRVQSRPLSPVPTVAAVATASTTKSVVVPPKLRLEQSNPYHRVP